MKKILIPLIFFALWANVAQAYPNTVCISATPTVDTSAYATGDEIGGKLTFTGACRATTGTGFITSVRITDKSAQASDLELDLFSSNPTATTFSDQAAFDPDDTDLAKIISVLSFGSTARFAYNDNGVKYLGSQSLTIRCEDSSALSTNILYGVLVSRGTPTFAAAADVTVTICISQD